MADDILEIIEIDMILGLAAAGVDASLAERVVAQQIKGIRESYGGVRYMLKRGYRRYSPEQVSKIQSEFNGRNHADLMREHGISRASLYRVLKK